MASFSYSDDEDKKLEGAKHKSQGGSGGGAQGGAGGGAGSGPPTFAELQRRGMPRPPPAIAALYGAAGQQPGGAYGAPTAGLPPGGYATPGSRPPTIYAGEARPQEQGFGGRGAPGQQPYQPGNTLNQGNLEGYLYDMLANPTQTPTYQNIMRKVGADIDVDASRRGVFHSTIPVGAYSQAGGDVASTLSQQAFGNLQNYNQNYEQLLMALMGAS